MRRLSVVITTSALIALLAPPAAGAAPSTSPPPNDSWANAIVLTRMSGSVKGDLTYATRETGENFPGNKSAWYRWTAPLSGDMTFSLCGGSTWDSRLYVLTDLTGPSQAESSLVTAGDDFCGLTSAVTFTATQTVTYWILVSNYEWNDAGPFTLRWQTGGSTSHGTVTVVIATSSVAGHCTMQVKGSGLLPGQTIKVFPKIGDIIWLTVDTLAGSWTYSTVPEVMEAVTWNRVDAVPFIPVDTIYAADGATLVTPRITDRCAAP